MIKLSPRARLFFQRFDDAMRGTRIYVTFSLIVLLIGVNTLSPVKKAKNKYPFDSTDCRVPNHCEATKKGATPTIRCISDLLISQNRDVKLSIYGRNLGDKRTKYPILKIGSHRFVAQQRSDCHLEVNIPKTAFKALTTLPQDFELRLSTQKDSKPYTFTVR